MYNYWYIIYAELFGVFIKFINFSFVRFFVINDAVCVQKRVNVAFYSECSCFALPLPPCIPCPVSLVVTVSGCYCLLLLSVVTVSGCLRLSLVVTMVVTVSGCYRGCHCLWLLPWLSLSLVVTVVVTVSGC